MFLDSWVTRSTLTAGPSSISYLVTVGPRVKPVTWASTSNCSSTSDSASTIGVVGPGARLRRGARPQQRGGRQRVAAVGGPGQRELLGRRGPPPCQRGRGHHGRPSVATAARRGRGVARPWPGPSRAPAPVHARCPPGWPIPARAGPGSPRPAARPRGPRQHPQARAPRRRPAALPWPRDSMPPSSGVSYGFSCVAGLRWRPRARRRPRGSGRPQRVALLAGPSPRQAARQPAPPCSSRANSASRSRDPVHRRAGDDQQRRTRRPARAAAPRSRRSARRRAARTAKKPMRPPAGAHARPRPRSGAACRWRCARGRARPRSARDQPITIRAVSALRSGCRSSRQDSRASRSGTDQRARAERAADHWPSRRPRPLPRCHQVTAAVTIAAPRMARPIPSRGARVQVAGAAPDGPHRETDPVRGDHPGGHRGVPSQPTRIGPGCVACLRARRARCPCPAGWRGRCPAGAAALVCRRACRPPTVRGRCPRREESGGHGHGWAACG